MTGNGIEKIMFNGLMLNTGDMNNTTGLILQAVGNKDRTEIFTHLNVYNYYVVVQDPELSKSLSSSSYLFFDGIAMKLSAWLTGKGWHIDVNGTDMLPIVMEKASEQGLSIYLLGGEEHVITEARRRLTVQYPELKIAGCHSGYFDELKELEIIENINSLSPDLLICGMGIRRECEFAMKHRYDLNVSCIWNVGGLFDFISGNKPRAPEILRKLRLEWFFRFMIEPKRMYFRYFVLPFWLAFHIAVLNLRRIPVLRYD
jgi:exopolysaccharide biosynthesis WecB/TagA/CpsF family protein